MRELAYLELEADGDDPVDAEAAETFDAEVDAAAEGRFDELGIDARPLPRSL